MEYVPAVTVVFVILSFFSSFLAVAEQTSDKIGVFAYEMEVSMDCALSGVHVSHCASYQDFTNDLTSYQQLLNQTERDMYALSAEYNLGLLD